ncbi:hypothetical protein LTR22_026546 [Elasticomyces elasticus]|nr:hypothetical protein LTR22_026546 [Elasticomyces elasticus]
MPPGSRFRVSKSPYKVTKKHAFITDEAVNIVAPIRGGWTAVLVHHEDGNPTEPTLMGYQSNYGLILLGPYKITPLQRDLDFTLARVWRSENPENSGLKGLTSQVDGLSLSQQEEETRK